jgi:CxxC-x17-CxxC domain-containing protein
MTVDDYIGESMMEKGFGRRTNSDRESRKMYKTKCSECGQETEVPFEPDPDRDVFCRECYAKKRSRKF